MFSKPIFKQSLRANWKLWAVITAVGSLMLTTFTLSFDAESMATLASASEGTSFANILSTMTTLLGSMESFYKMMAVLLGIIYVLFTANSLVVNEVDSGSMAYTLSTPIKRSSVIFTKMTYLVTSIILMFTVIGGVGLGVSQAKYGNVTGYAITEDIRQAANALDKGDRYVSEHLYLITEDKDALREAASARNMDTESYTVYLNQLMETRSYDVAADILTSENRDEHGDDDDWSDSEIEVTVKEIKKNPSLILESTDALEAGADVMGMTVAQYRTYLANQKAALNNKSQTAKVPTNAALILQTAIDAASDTLGVSADKIEDNMSLMKDKTALEAASKATNLSTEQLSTMIDGAMISTAQSVDKALDFDLEAYIWLNVGITLLVLALGSISFFASTFFNRTGSAMALGGGLPFAFFLISMIQQQADGMEDLKYFTLTTFYDTSEIIAGGDFGLGLLALAGIATVLYAISTVIFCKKDLPL